MLTLGGLQRAVERLYGLDPGPAVDDYVISMGEQSSRARRREALLVQWVRARGGEPGELRLALELHDEVFRALRGETVPGFSRFDAWCAALEGVSHFTFVVFRAARRRPVSQLELELQAEVDKYAVALLERAHLRPALYGRAVSRRLREALFERVHFYDAPHTARGRRYRLASRWAQQYTGSLEARFVGAGKLDALVSELRGFYRRGIDDKARVARAAA